jgi:tetratricopeptide (TPR) repeat protein
MKIIMTALLLAAFLTIPLPSFAEMKTITHTVQQPFGGSQSPDDARTAGIARAKREALEQFGTYIESTTIVKNSQVDSDEILALTAGVTKAEVVKQKNYTDGDGFGLEITVKVELDTAVLDKSLKRLLEDRNHLKDLKAAREREKKLLAQIVALEQENQKKGKTKQQTAKLKNEFQAAKYGLTAVEWFDKVHALWDGNKYIDPEKAIEYLTQAIRLDPSFVATYNNRGLAYYNLKQFERAITDFDQAISLEPDNAVTYINRGNVYEKLKQYGRAIADYDLAIGLDPNKAAT